MNQVNKTPLTGESLRKLSIKSFGQSINSPRSHDDSKNHEVYLIEFVVLCESSWSGAFVVKVKVAVFDHEYPHNLLKRNVIFLLQGMILLIEFRSKYDLFAFGSNAV
jgi:hypothetical protein